MCGVVVWFWDRCMCSGYREGRFGSFKVVRYSMRNNVLSCTSKISSPRALSWVSFVGRWLAWMSCNDGKFQGIYFMRRLGLLFLVDRGTSFPERAGFPFLRIAYLTLTSLTVGTSGKDSFWRDGRDACYFGSIKILPVKSQALLGWSETKILYCKLRLFFSVKRALHLKKHYLNSDWIWNCDWLCCWERCLERFSRQTEERSLF